MKETKDQKIIRLLEDNAWLEKTVDAKILWIRSCEREIQEIKKEMQAIKKENIDLKKNDSSGKLFFWRAAFFAAAGTQILLGAFYKWFS